MEDGHRPKDRRGAVPLLGGTAPVLTKQHRKFDYLALFFDTSCAVVCDFEKDSYSTTDLYISVGTSSRIPEGYYPSKSAQTYGGKTRREILQ